MVKFVEVSWDDAWSDMSEFVTLNDALHGHRPSAIRTRGWLLVDNEVGVTLCSDHSPEDDTYRGRTFIPRVLVKSTTILPEPRKPRKKREVKAPPPIPDPS